MSDNQERAREWLLGVLDDPTSDEHGVRLVALLDEVEREARSKDERVAMERDALLAERDAARAEVARLEGLILEWYRNEDDEPSWVALVAEANRIRAERENIEARREEGRDGKA